jgi:hypothetical protein
MDSIKRWSFFLLTTILLTGCKVNYSFTGASVSPDVKTLSIATFPSYQAPLAPPSLGQSFTENLKDIFLRQTNLTLVKTNGDLIIEGEITQYQTRDEAVTGNDVSTVSRLTIIVNVRYTDTKNEDNSYEKSFTNFAQFDGNQTLSSVESQLIEEINEKLAQDIFNASLGNW